MKNAIILHGICSEKEYLEEDFPSPSNAHWLPWLQQKFLRSGVLCQCLEMPTPYEPKYEEWKEIFERFFSSNLSTIVGHSAGCGFILKWLNHNLNTKLDKLVLVAPYVDPKKERGNFLEFEFNKNALKNVKEIHLFISDDDRENMQLSTEKILTEYPNIIVHRYSGLGHFTSKRVGTSFEDFWEVCK